MSSAPEFDARKLLRRDEPAVRVGALYERHGRMVYGLCRAMLRDADDAEDATQQTFVSAHQALLRGAAVRDDGAWIAAIARNECRARIAALMRTPVTLAEDGVGELATPHDEAERRAQAEEIRKALAELPRRQQEAVALRYVYGLPYGEVATALGLSRPAVEALLFRARRAMQVRLRALVSSALVLPGELRDRLAEQIPGFAATGGGGAASVAGAGIIAKLAAAPISAKLAAAAAAVTTVGAVGVTEVERSGPAVRVPTSAAAPGQVTEARVPLPSARSRATSAAAGTHTRDVRDARDLHSRRGRDRDRSGSSEHPGSSDDSSSSPHTISVETSLAPTVASHSGSGSSGTPSDGRSSSSGTGGSGSSRGPGGTSTSGSSGSSSGPGDGTTTQALSSGGTSGPSSSSGSDGGSTGTDGGSGGSTTSGSGSSGGSSGSSGSGGKG